MKDKIDNLEVCLRECLDMAVYLKKAILEQAGNTARCACGHCVEDHKEDGWCTWSLCNCAEVVEIKPNQEANNAV